VALPFGVTHPATTQSARHAWRWQATAADRHGTPGRAETDEVTAAQLAERSQKMMLVAQPSLVFHYQVGMVTIRADAERISPIATAADIDSAYRHTDLMRVENCAHRSSPPDPPVAANWRPGAARLRGSRMGSWAMRERLAR
jgi:hypothetical protein